ncbi:hypothetical protein WKV44_10605, partial [Spirochaetia bacterium 38H-sp]
LAPVSDEARRHNRSLPGMGGVYNLVNLQLYHYAGNNPVKYTDPDGREDRTINTGGFLGGFQRVVSFIIDNRDALLTISAGALMVVGGNILKGFGVGGAGTATVGSGGTLAVPAVAAGAAVVATGEALEVTGASTVAVGLTMLASGTNNGFSSKTPIGRRGNPIKTLGNNTSTEINGRRFTAHALDQMQGRGIMPSAVENAIKNGSKIPGNTEGTTVHIFDNIKVITNSLGDVVTVIPQ